MKNLRHIISIVYLVSAVRLGSVWADRGGKGSIRGKADGERELQGNGPPDFPGNADKKPAGGIFNDVESIDNDEKFKGNKKDGIKDQYIIVFSPSDQDVKGRANSIIRRFGGEMKFVYENTVQGFAVSKLTEGSARAIARNEEVMFVEQDSVVKKSTLQPQEVFDPNLWGLDRIDQRPLSRDSKYFYDDALDPVDAFVIDTGIRISHSEFSSGRAEYGKNFVGDQDEDDASDCDGHGTHVAGTIGGNTFGVSKTCKVKAVRVLDCGGYGSWSGIVAGIDWVAHAHENYADFGYTGRSVANLSLGGGPSATVDQAIQRLVAAGVTTVVAAGNSNGDACTQSPAREPSAITVGSTTRTDERSSFSNFGPCVDIFAPGSSILSSLAGSDTDTGTYSGTSMAAPHVAGAAALHLARDGSLTPAEVLEELQRDATSVTIDDASIGPGSPNLLLYVGGSCEQDSDCEGGNPCLIYECVNSSAEPCLGGTNCFCINSNQDIGTDCSDGNSCNGLEQCDGNGSCETLAQVCSASTATVRITTDRYPSETSWMITDASGDVVARGSGYERDSFVENADLVSNCAQNFAFTILDSYGDGMCCAHGKGKYSVEYRGEIVAEGGRYAYSESNNFVVLPDSSCSGSNPTPTEPPPAPASCDYKKKRPCENNDCCWTDTCKACQLV